MSKENLRKHTSIKNTLPGFQKRESLDFKQSASDIKLSTTTSEQTQVMKKIQNKLRMRKRSSNLNTNQRTISPPQISSNENASSQNISEGCSLKGLQAYDLSLNISETVERILQMDEHVIQKISLSNSDTAAIKEHLIRDSTFILCQLNKGRKIEEIILQRVTGIIQSNKLIQKIQKKEKSIMAMMDERIKRLMQLQKPLVH